MEHEPELSSYFYGLKCFLNHSKEIFFGFHYLLPYYCIDTFVLHTVVPIAGKIQIVKLYKIKNLLTCLYNFN